MLSLDQELQHKSLFLDRKSDSSLRGHFSFSNNKSDIVSSVNACIRRYGSAWLSFIILYMNLIKDFHFEWFLPKRHASKIEHCV